MLVVSDEDDAGVEASINISSDEQDEFLCFPSSFAPFQDLTSSSEHSPVKGSKESCSRYT